MENSEDSAEDPNAEDPNAEDPNAEDPNAEDPNAEDPNAEDPNAEDPNVEDNAEKNDGSTSEAEFSDQGDIITRLMYSPVRCILSPLPESEDEAENRPPLLTNNVQPPLAVNTRSSKSNKRPPTPRGTPMAKRLRKK